MANTLKDMASSAKLVAQGVLEEALKKLKAYVDQQDTKNSGTASEDVKKVQQQLDALIGSTEDTDKVINTFNEIKAFLKDYSEDNTLKGIVDAAISSATTAASTAETNAKAYADTEVGKEKTRAEGAEKTLGDRITTLENISIMTATEATTIFNSVFTTN